MSTLYRIVLVVARKKYIDFVYILIFDHPEYFYSRAKALGAWVLWCLSSIL